MIELNSPEIADYLVSLIYKINWNYRLSVANVSGIWCVRCHGVGVIIAYNKEWRNIPSGWFIHRDYTSNNRDILITDFTDEKFLISELSRLRTRR